MKKLVFFIIGVFVLIFISDRILFEVFNKIYKHILTGQTGGKINYYLYKKTTPDLLIMGSSSAYYQIIPDSISKSSFNMGHAGMDDAFQSALLSVLLENNKKPKRIILVIDVFNYLSSYPNYSKPSLKIQNLKYYYGSNALVTKYINEISPFEKIKYFFKSYRFNGRILNLIKNYMETSFYYEENKTGYKPVSPSPLDSINTIYSMNFIEGDSFIVSKQSFRYLYDFIKICKDNNIELTFLTTPVFNPNVKYMVNVSNTIESICKEKNIYYLNYLKINFPELQNHPKFWKDIFHLNHDGAQILSGDIAMRLSEKYKEDINSKLVNSTKPN
jgi:hypothetical protein